MEDFNKKEITSAQKNELERERSIKELERDIEDVLGKTQEEIRMKLDEFFKKLREQREIRPIE